MIEKIEGYSEQAHIPTSPNERANPLFADKIAKINIGIIIAIAEKTQQVTEDQWRRNTLTKTIYLDCSIRELIEWAVKEDIDLGSGIKILISQQ